MLKKLSALIFAIILAASFSACQKSAEVSEAAETAAITENAATATEDEAVTTEPATVAATAKAATTQPATAAATSASPSNSDTQTESSVNVTKSTTKTEQVTSTANTTSGGMINTSELFTNRDLTQTADTYGATIYTVSDNQNITITAEGVYILQGSANNVTVTIEAGDEDKVQLLLDGVTLTNSNAPCIYVKNADKVFVTTAGGTTNTLSVTGSFSSDGSTNTDAVIFSKDDLVLNGLGTLNIRSTDNGITSKDDLKITGGTLNITCNSDALEANESIAVSDGNITINTGKDGLHAEYDEDNSTGYIYICGGTFNITAGSDGMQATTVCQIDGGNIRISAGEGIEGTFVQINGGDINISASDDGINASRKSTAYNVRIEINGGNVTVNMGQGDTDGIDSNGDLYINGGTVTVNAQSPFDYDGTAQKTGGTIIVNGTRTDSITNQMMGGMGGMQPNGQAQGNAPMQGGFNGR